MQVRASGTETAFCPAALDEFPGAAAPPAGGAPAAPTGRPPASGPPPPDESPQPDSRAPYDDPVITTDLAVRIADAQPGVQVTREPHLAYGPEVAGWRLPGWAVLPVLGLAVATLGLLIGGPQPWRATRWAWFWLLGSPWTLLAFLVLSGPAPLLPAPRDPARRLTGGWAFLLGALVGLTPLGR